MTKRAKVISRTQAGNIIKLRDGRFKIDCVDSRGKRHRPSGFATKDDAAAAIAQIAAQKSSGEFIAAGANMTFSTLLDKLIEDNILEGKARASRKRVESVIRAHLRPLFGKRKLSEFTSERMQFVQQWLNEEAHQRGKAKQTLDHIKSAFTLAFELAILDKIIGPPNPSKEWLKVPKLKKKTRRAPLTPEEISALVRSALTKAAEDKDELTWAARGMAVMIGLLAGWRPGEIGGLCWDCVNLPGRMLFMRRVLRTGEGIVPDSKTGEAGKRDTHMSPLLLALFLDYRQRLQSMGCKTEGEVPVLMTTQGALFSPLSISGDHWPVLATKAGFQDADGGLKHTSYALRTTCANLWRTGCNMQIDDVSELLGHRRIDTTTDSYTKRTPSYEPIRLLVNELIRRHHDIFADTPAGRIDALGVVLAQHWKHAGANLPPSALDPPTSAPQQIGYQDALPTPTTIDVVITDDDAPVPVPPTIVTAHDLREWQSEHAKQLYKIGWTKNRIARKLRIGFPTVQHWLRHADIPHTRGRLPRAQRQDLMERIGVYRDQHPEASTTEIALALGVHAKRITLWERRRGKPMPHRPGAHKIGRYEADIRRMIARGLTCHQMAAELKRTYPTAKTPAASGIWYFIKRLGLKLQRRGGGLRVENYGEQICDLVAAGRSKEEIAREVDGPSRSGIIGFINRLELRTVPGDRGKRIAKMPEIVE